MTAPMPREDEVVDIFNKLGDLGVNDGEAASRYATRLMRLSRQRPNDFICHTALSRALRFCGDRDGGLKAFKRAWALQDPADYVTVVALAGEALNYGQFSEARAVVEDVYLRKGGRGLETRALGAALAGFALGDPKLVLKAAQFEEATVGPGIVARYADVLHGSEIGAYLEGHQSTVMGVIGQHLCCTEMDILEYDDSEVATIFLDHYLSVEEGDLKRLRHAVFDAIEEYYETIGVSPAVVAPYFHNSLAVMPRMPVVGIA